MALLELNLKPSVKDLRWFAGLWFPALWLFVGAILLRRHYAFATVLWVWALAALWSALGLWKPPAIRPAYLALMWLTFPIGWVISHVLLVTIYFLVFTPIGFLVRRFHDPMERRYQRSARSYWIARQVATKDTYVRQL